MNFFCVGHRPRRGLPPLAVATERRTLYGAPLAVACIPAKRIMAQLQLVLSFDQFSHHLRRGGEPHTLALPACGYPQSYGQMRLPGPCFAEKNHWFLARQVSPFAAVPHRRCWNIWHALEMGCSNAGAIRYLLNVNGLEKGPTAKPADIGALSRYDRPLPSLDAYDRLHPNWLATEVIQ